MSGKNGLSRLISAVKEVVETYSQTPISRRERRVPRNELLSSWRERLMMKMTKMISSMRCWNCWLRIWNQFPDSKGQDEARSVKKWQRPWASTTQSKKEIACTSSISTTSFPVIESALNLTTMLWTSDYFINSENKIMIQPFIFVHISELMKYRRLAWILRHVVLNVGLFCFENSVEILTSHPLLFIFLHLAVLTFLSIDSRSFSD